MFRLLLAAAALVLVAAPARADRAFPILGPAERALRAPVVVVGKVTAVEKDAVDARPYPGADAKLPFKIAVVKIETALSGAADLTHIKVGFAPTRRYEVTLTEGQECLFFLEKHHEEAFHVMPSLMPPIDVSAGDFKQSVEEAKKGLAAVTDPAKALKAEKAEDRAAAAAAIVYKLRSLAEETPKVSEAVALTADESRPILKALAEGVWKLERREQTLGAYRAFILLGLGEADGWRAPNAEAGKDYVELTRQAYVKWLDGPGKDYRIKKLVPKKEK